MAGKPVRDAVVSVYPDGGPAATRPSGAYRVVQQNLQFDPFVLVVPVGAEVSFPNRDAVRHHVYSFSPANKFELRLYGKDETRKVKFDKAGVVALGCNIHDQMVGFVKVVDTPFAVLTGDTGEAVLRGLPAGGATVRIWHPYAKVAKNEIERRMTLPRDVALHEAITFDLRAPPERRGGY
ncbi:MAG: methylamine utilization protein [Caulobacteraceae bacterium]